MSKKKNLFLFLIFLKQKCNFNNMNKYTIYNRYMHDTVYIIWGVLGLCWITEWFWFILLVVKFFKFKFKFNSVFISKL